jgi:hypothetical protein
MVKHRSDLEAAVYKRALEEYMRALWRENSAWFRSFRSVSKMVSNKFPQATKVAIESRSRACAFNPNCARRASAALDVEHSEKRNSGEIRRYEKASKDRSKTCASFSVKP